MLLSPPLGGNPAKPERGTKDFGEAVISGAYSTVMDLARMKSLHATFLWPRGRWSR